MHPELYREQAQVAQAAMAYDDYKEQLRMYNKAKEQPWGWFRKGPRSMTLADT